MREKIILVASSWWERCSRLAWNLDTKKGEGLFWLSVYSSVNHSRRLWLPGKLRKQAKLTQVIMCSHSSISTCVHHVKRERSLRGLDSIWCSLNGEVTVSHYDEIYDFLKELCYRKNEKIFCLDSIQKSTFHEESEVGSNPSMQKADKADVVRKA